MEEQSREMNFLIAKYLMAHFPDVGSAFVSRCEKERVLPKAVFPEERSFQELDQKALSNIECDHIMKLANLSCPKAKMKSFLFQTENYQPAPASDRMLMGDAPVGTFLDHISPSISITGHFDSITKCIIDSTGNLLITGAADTFIKVWSLPEVILMSTLSGHNAEITGIVLNPTNTLLFSSSNDKTICLYTLSDGSFQGRIKIKCGITTFGVTTSGNVLAVACDDGCVRLFNVHSEIPKIEREPYVVLSANSSKIISIDFFNDKILAFASESSKVVFASLDKMKYFTVTNGDDGGNDITFFQNGDLLVRNQKDKVLKILKKTADSYDTEIVLNSKEGTKQKIVSASLSCDEQSVVGISQTEILVWNANDGSILGYGSGLVATDNCCFLAMHPKIPFVAFVGTNTGFCGIWDLTTMKILHSYQDFFESKITSAEWSPCGTRIIIGDSLGKLTLFSLESNLVSIKEQFMGKELNLNSNDNRVFDKNKTLLEPQPGPKRLQDYNLATKVPSTPIALPFDVDQWSNPEINGIVYYFNTSNAPKKPLTPPRPQIPKDLLDYEIELDPILNESSDSESNNSSDESSDTLPIPTTLPDWTFWTKQQQHTYIPQVGEEVIYCKQGHKSLYKLFHIDYIKAPYEYKPTMPKIAQAKIIQSRFAITHFVLTLEFLCYENFVCDVAYALPDTLPFIIPVWKYYEAVDYEQTLNVGSKIKIPYIEDTGVVIYDAIVEEISQDFKAYPFESLTVGFIDGGDMSKISPWEIQLEEQAQHSSIIELQKQIAPHLKEFSEKFKIYNEIRDSNHMDILFMSKRLPMDLMLLNERIDNLWYSTFDEVLKDVSLFSQNSPLIGIPDDIGHDLSNKLTAMFTEKAILLGIS